MVNFNNSYALLKRVVIFSIVIDSLVYTCQMSKLHIFESDNYQNNMILYITPLIKKKQLHIVVTTVFRIQECFQFNICYPQLSNI